MGFEYTDSSVTPIGRLHIEDIDHTALSDLRVLTRLYAATQGLDIKPIEYVWIQEVLANPANTLYVGRNRGCIVGLVQVVLMQELSGPRAFIQVLVVLPEHEELAARLTLVAEERITKLTHS